MSDPRVEAAARAIAMEGLGYPGEWGLLHEDTRALHRRLAEVALAAADEAVRMRPDAERVSFIVDRAKNAVEIADGLIPGGAADPSLRSWCRVYAEDTTLLLDALGLAGSAQGESAP